MMSETTTKPTTSTGPTGVDGASVTDRPTEIDGTSSAMSAVAERASDAADTTTDGTDPTTSSATNATATGSRKRIFTFQKRWLHTLPIMEKVLPDTALDAASIVALRAANLLGEDGKPIDAAGAREVIVCMLCDDPNSNRETLKLWSRLNCRRGRIENHLMSKHPEFMLLLKQKRETEGDLAVQIFLQNMREGRCNVRNEISAGLYSHMQSISNVELTGNSHKRAFGHDEFMMPTTAAGTALSTSTGVTPLSTIQPKHISGTFGHDSGSESADNENRRKRLKTNTNGDAVTGTGETDNGGDPLAVPLLSFQGPSAFSRWKNLLSSKMVVITGGEAAVIARVATNMWLVGANVLVTFAEQGAMEAFAASYLTQFHTAAGMEPPRGVMLPLFCSLQTRSETEEWSRSIATKFGQVDYLINFVHPDPQSESTNANRCRELCEVFSAACMQRSNRSAIVNITSQTSTGDDCATSAAVEAMTMAMSTSIEPLNVQVNTIVLQQPDVPATGEDDVDLIHLILFLLSPASACVSGSVLRHRRNRLATTEDHVVVDPTGTVQANADPHNGTVSSAPTGTQPNDATTSGLSNGVELEAHVI